MLFICFKMNIKDTTRWLIRVRRSSSERREDGRTKVGAVQSWRRKITALGKWRSQGVGGGKVELHRRRKSAENAWCSLQPKKRMREREPQEGNPTCGQEFCRFGVGTMEDWQRGSVWLDITGSNPHEGRQK